LRLLIGALAIGVAIAISGPAQAETAPIKVSFLDCTFHIEIIKIKNESPVAQDVAGWELRSDPEKSEKLDLAIVGTIKPGEEISFVGGPHAVPEEDFGVFVFSLKYTLRDSGSPPDYIRLVDPSGDEASRENCRAATPKPTAKPTAKPTPKPTPKPTTANPTPEATPDAEPGVPTASPSPAPGAGDPVVAGAVQPPARPAADPPRALPDQGGAPPGLGTPLLPFWLGLALAAAGSGLLIIGMRRT